jgi:hypothetical protein
VTLTRGTPCIYNRPKSGSWHSTHGWVWLNGTRAQSDSLARLVRLWAPLMSNRTNAGVLMVPTWRSGVYHLLPTCHIHVTVRIRFLVSECLLSYFSKLPRITTIIIWTQVLGFDPVPQHLHQAVNTLAHTAGCEPVWATDVFAFSSSFLSVDGITCYISF